MLGKGLESLIPKKNNQNGQQTIRQQGSSYNDSHIITSSSRGHHDDGDVLPQTPGETLSHREPPTITGPVFQIEVEKIQLNPYQPRKDYDEEGLSELAASIREFGILQPLLVSKITEETDTGARTTYQLIAGHRRLLAAKQLGFKTVPVVIRNTVKKTEALEMAIVENIQREDLNSIETARAYSRLSEEFGMTQREIATRLGKSRESIANAMRLLSLSTDMQDAIAKGTLNESQARLLMQMPDIVKQKQLFEEIVQKGLSVREIQHRIKAYAEPTLLEHSSSQEHKEGPVVVEDLELKNMERILADFLGAPVSVEFSRNGGKIVIHFYSPEEAFGIAKKIQQEEQ